MKLIHFLGIITVSVFSCTIIGMDLSKKYEYENVQQHIWMRRRGFPKNTRFMKVVKDPITNTNTLEWNTTDAVKIREFGNKKDPGFLFPYFSWEPLSNLAKKWKSQFPENKFPENIQFTLYYTKLHEDKGIWKEGNWIPLRRTDKCSTLNQYINEYKKANKEFYLDINTYLVSNKNKRL